MKESKLIKQYMQNKELNIEEVIEDYTNYIYIVVKNRDLKLSDEDIEEIISDVFLAVWKNQKNLDTNKEMSAYLTGIAKNVYSKKIRKFKNIVDIEKYENILYNDENIDDKIEETQKSNMIMAEIYAMKKEDKDIFILYYYYSKSMKEIAKELKITEYKVKSRLFRIRKKLKKILEKRGYSYHG